MSETIETILEPIQAETGVRRTRVRINHSRTIKEGWGHETTVEVEWSGDGVEDDAEAMDRLHDLLSQADGLGRKETAMRRRLDAAAEAREAAS